ncbi:MAG: AbrB/MazE/SpoVT family DNA-binding domain-containing protein [Alphaproteobacteria bacterium]|jgi:AbrB family looped-hinge helix DNA binding protein|nr:AbrB/MazE/SpoVT family DNA-binding domain-containing protein [Alphaproteobacteria bacterium]
MYDSVSITERGTLTLPAHLRKAMGLTGGQQFIITAMPTGELLLRPATTIPMEVYSEERIAEFASEEAAIKTLLGTSHGAV